MLYNGDALELLLTPLYFGFFYLLAVGAVNRNSSNPLYQQYYIKGLNYKFMGGIFFALIYMFYYRGGDSLAFYAATRPLFKLLFSDPASFFEFVFIPTANYPASCYYEASQYGVAYLLRGSPTLTTIRIGAIANVFCLNTYLPMCLVFAYLSYTFQWRTFMLLCKIYPKLTKQFAYAFLMIPSVLFWGSGVSKDSIMIGSIMYFFYNFYMLVIERRNAAKHFFMLILAGYLISLIRGFILFTILPCLVLMAVTYYRNAIGSSLLRFVIGPIFVLGGIFVSIFFVQSLGSAVESYNIDALQQKAEGFKSWHTYLGETQGGSSYSLGEDVEFTPLGVLKQAPLALVITLFGPFVWQIRNLVMLMSGIESLFFLFFAVRVLINKRIYALLGILIKDHIIVFCLPLVLILSVAIGITSYNYGALVRYRIPILPFFAIMLIVINYHLNGGDTAEQTPT